MVSTFSSVREAVVCSIESIDTICNIRGGMRVHQIDDDSDAHGMGLVDKVLEVVGGARSGRNSEESGYVVAERPIVSMLLAGHQLYNIVASFFNSRQNIVSVCSVLTDTATFMSHAHMRLVDAHSLLYLGHNWLFVCPFMSFLRIFLIINAVEETRITLLVHGGPGGVSIHSRVVSADNVKLVTHSVFDSLGAIL